MTPNVFAAHCGELRDLGVGVVSLTRAEERKGQERHATSGSVDVTLPVPQLLSGTPDGRVAAPLSEFHLIAVDALEGRDRRDSVDHDQSGAPLLQ